MNSPCGHREAICIVGNYWECITCDAPKQEEKREIHTNYGCDRWGWNCGSPDCKYPHKFKIGDRVKCTIGPPGKLIIGTVSRYLKHSKLSNQEYNVVSWDKGGSGCMLDHDIETYKDNK